MSLDCEKPHKNPTESPQPEGNLNLRSSHCEATVLTTAHNRVKVIFIMITWCNVRMT